MDSNQNLQLNSMSENALQLYVDQIQNRILNTQGNILTVEILRNYMDAQLMLIDKVAEGKIKINSHQVAIANSTGTGKQSVMEIEAEVLKKVASIKDEFRRTLVGRQIKFANFIKQTSAEIEQYKDNSLLYDSLKEVLDENFKDYINDIAIEKKSFFNKLNALVGISI